jgi:hypothetical protein
VVPSRSPAIEFTELLVTSCLLAASHASADGTSEPDAAADDEGSHSAWSFKRVTRYGVVRWLGALLHGKTRGSAPSDFELLNAAILQETRRRDASKSGEQRKIIAEAGPSASVLLETAPQVRQNRIRWRCSRSPLVNPTEAPQLVAEPGAVPVAAPVSRFDVHFGTIAQAAGFHPILIGAGFTCPCWPGERQHGPS